MSLWIEKLQKRWGVNSPWQVVVILVVFACTGFSSLYFKRWVYSLAGWSPENWAWWQSLLGTVFIVLPVYQVLLLCYGWLFGQFQFFWNFEKRMFSRIIGRKL